MKVLMPPYRYLKLKKEYFNKSVNILDVGCGPNGPLLAKKYFPKCNYYALDINNFKNSEKYRAIMKEFYHVNLETDNLTSVPEKHFDLIIFSHVIEHLSNGLDVIKKLTSKLNSEGKIYVEFPSPRTLFFPNAIRKGGGLLNFCDDPSHICIYSIKDIANGLLKNGFTIVKAGKARKLLYAFLAPFFLPIQIYFYLKYKKFSFRFGIWDFLGVGEFVYAKKR
jgi:2-polyprenyl-3-methyl-5-hydroxy-6-metoxy-1,4-benzoquinol methylase